MPIIKRIASEEYADEKALYEALKAVENIPQSDWNQNDETAVDFIKNKPFYDIKVPNIIYDGQIDLMKTYDWDGLEGSDQDGGAVLCEEGHIYNAIFNNENNEFVCQEVVCDQDGYLTLYVQDSDFYVEIIYNSICIFSTNPEYFDYDIFEEGIYNLKVAEIGTVPKTLDEKFIPDTIARIKNIPQSDWNQSDENAVDFVKNRTHYENIVEASVVLVDEEIYLEMLPDVSPEGYWSEPITLENGKTYTVTANKIGSGIICEQEIVCENDELFFTFTGYDFSLTIKSEVVYGDEDTYHIKIETTEVSTAIKQLDEKFIPDTIARVEDIPSEEYINSLIDAKLGVIANGTY